MAATAGTPRRWRGQTHDDRVHARRRRLLAAGYALLGDDGTAGVSMRAVCRHAGLSLRYFYENFADTDALITAVYDECNSELLAAITAAALPLRAELDRAVRAAIDAGAGYFAADPRRVRILLREPLSNDLLTDRRAAVAPELLGALVQTGGLDPRGPAAVHAMTASAFSGAFTALILDWSDGRLAVDRAQLVDYAATLVLSQLGGSATVQP
ncbi:TetR/AcrR family transcriptional regulator [Mycolicibacillus parakoreensis]|uniref:TetR/AcrR family transcriptional regulator n=1 Tax=Mycolicibacillus parakoreensis TaxID=1069221 RepID=A0ABY3TZ59_9MYCO|nr:TetR/AcrR family transcriptional regulator [Mycolicibacillus parakoreensis]MCV7316268.1 TetR/AcrR family transcriptional regulator [Mycolicibacillus parakoreensis]ULN52517.1 TetR/AcrR family transcriptional regulator [Mycolicibacillus parakoreensis]